MRLINSYCGAGDQLLIATFTVTELLSAEIRTTDSSLAGILADRFAVVVFVAASRIKSLAAFVVIALSAASSFLAKYT